MLTLSRAAPPIASVQVAPQSQEPEPKIIARARRHRRRPLDHARHLLLDDFIAQHTIAPPVAQMFRQIAIGAVREPVPGAGFAARRYACETFASLRGLGSTDMQSLELHFSTSTMPSSQPRDRSPTD